MSRLQRNSLLFGLLVLALLISPASARAAVDQPPTAETLCLPGVYHQAPQDCLPLGPSAYLTRMDTMGISFPLRSLATKAPDSVLSQVPYYYAKVTSPDAPIFPSLEAAMAGKEVKRRLEPGFNYVSYIDVSIVDGIKYYMIDFGEWMRAGDLSAGVAVSTFQGMEFAATPGNSFGWIVFPTQPQRNPGLYPDEPNGEPRNRWDFVQVYATAESDGLLWYLIGPDQWVDQRYIAVVYPSLTPPEGVENGRWVEVNLFEQTIAVYQDNRLVFATIMSSGVPGFWTRPGLFQITEKLESTPMSGAFEADRSDYYYLEDVPWTMYFDEARALHGAYWHSKLGFNQSHGCVNLSTGDSKWLFDWAQVGDWVYVWDPSGETPTDPALYGAGGA